ncbi:MAG: hypothetical protein IKU78_00315 [Paludibacteraceae bacterium]|nr:hypothetical protein [Paludibacteraceae bacterium]
MKIQINKIMFATLMFVASAVFTACEYDDSDVLNRLGSLENRVAKLEKLCKENNTNIASIQAIVEVLNSQDYVVSVSPISYGGVEVGYTITIAVHEPITIYHGQDGIDASAPIIGAKEEGGVYYWTIDGEWLLDENGNKLRVSGQNGANGTNGEDGEDGQDGVNGEDGVTPQLKIEEDYWWISYDNGATWTKLEKATGEDGAKGDKGDSMFQSVTYDEQAVYFTLADGTVITIDRISKEEATSGLENGYAWVDLGLSVKWATCNVGASKPEEYGCYFAWGEVEPKETYDWATYKWANGSKTTMTKYCADSSYGNNGFTDDKTVLDAEDDAATVNMGGSWRMPTVEEMRELIDGCTWTWKSKNGINGYEVKSKTNGNSIFLPVAGYNNFADKGLVGYYWSKSLNMEFSCFSNDLSFSSSYVATGGNYRCYGWSVRGVISK